MDRTVEIDRKQEAERGGMTHRIRPLGSGFEPGSPATRTIALTHGVGAIPAELCSTQLIIILIGKMYFEAGNHGWFNRKNV